MALFSDLNLLGLGGNIEVILLFAIAAAASALIVVFIFRRIRRYGSYSYANARIGAMKRALFRKEKLKQLLETRDLQNIISHMEDSPYSNYLENIEDISPRNIELSIRRHLADVYRKMVFLAPNEIREIYKEMQMILEIRNIKNILAKKQAGIVPKKIEEELFPPQKISKETYEKALEAEDISTTISAFEGSHYWEAINNGLSEYEERNNLLIILIRLEKSYWERLMKKIRETSAKASNVVKKGVGMKTDILNIMTILRCKREEVPPKEIKKLLVDAYSKIDSQTMKRAIEAEDVGEAVVAFEDTPYGENLSDKITKFEESQSISHIEKYLQLEVQIQDSSL